MEWSVVATITVGVLTLVGVVITAIKSSNPSMEETNHKNAKDINAQYKELNEGLRNEIKEDNEKFTRQIDELRRKLESMEKKFQERELFLQREIEVRDDRIEELEIIIISKNEMIMELKRGRDKTCKTL